MEEGQPHPPGDPLGDGLHRGCPGSQQGTGTAAEGLTQLASGIPELGLLPSSLLQA